MTLSLTFGLLKNAFSFQSFSVIDVAFSVKVTSCRLYFSSRWLYICVKHINWCANRYQYGQKRNVVSRFGARQFLAAHGFLLLQKNMYSTRAVFFSFFSCFFSVFWFTFGGCLLTFLSIETLKGCILKMNKQKKKNKKKLAHAHQFPEKNYEKQSFFFWPIFIYLWPIYI